MSDWDRKGWAVPSAQNILDAQQMGFHTSLDFSINVGNVSMVIFMGIVYIEEFFF